MQKDPRYLQKTGRGWQKEEMTDGQGNYYDQYGREYGWSVAQREQREAAERARAEEESRKRAAYWGNFYQDIENEMKSMFIPKTRFGSRLMKSVLTWIGCYFVVLMVAPKFGVYGGGILIATLAARYVWKSGKSGKSRKSGKRKR